MASSFAKRRDQRWLSDKKEITDFSEEDLLEKDYFPFDPSVTDLTLIVEGKKLHVSKMVLMVASSVFRKMFTSDFKEKSGTELELPGKEYSTFALFLRCIFPMEYVMIKGNYESLLHT